MIITVAIKVRISSVKKSFNKIFAESKNVLSALFKMRFIRQDS